jgi:DNA-binding CsgD family transcriptional regulator
VEQLTRREAQVSELLIERYGARAIAELLGISRHTVRVFVRSAYRKTDSHCRAQYLNWYMRNRATYTDIARELSELLLARAVERVQAHGVSLPQSDA